MKGIAASTAASRERDRGKWLAQISVNGTFGTELEAATTQAQRCGEPLRKDGTLNKVKRARWCHESASSDEQTRPPSAAAASVAKFRLATSEVRSDAAADRLML